MIKRQDPLDELSEEEAHEFLGSDYSLSPVRRYPPAPDGIKLTMEEARLALEGMPPHKLPPPDKAQYNHHVIAYIEDCRKQERIKRLGHVILAKREMAAINAYAQIAMSPEATADRRREAMQTAIG